MSPKLVSAVFAVLAAATAMKLVEVGADAIAEPTSRAWLVVGFWFLKTAIVGAFTYFVLVRPPSRRPSREPVAFAACAAALFGAVALQPPAGGVPTALLLAGETLALLSSVWLLASVLALGRCFGILPEARGLVTRGPYRLVRHPVYLGEYGVCAGLVISAPGQWNLACAALILVAQVVRMGLEERVLEAEFPAYTSYAASTPRLLPFQLSALPRRPALLLLLALGLAAAASTVALASGAGGAHDAAARRLAAPRQLSPGDEALVDAVPAFRWAGVRGAAKYEFQLSADPGFKSIVLGQGKGSFQTSNRYATVDKTLADGDYFWRVRAINKRDRAGRWSRVRSISKAWTSRPRLVSPSDGGSVTYPSTPLVLRWDPVPRAYKYLVQIATDPSLAHSALGDRTPRIETSGSSFALPGALAPGRYYWAITPLDGEKHPGVRSSVSAFDWSWPTGTTARVTDLNPDLRVFDPQFSWDPVPGAARYQVEVNPSEDWAVGSRVCCDEAAIGTSLSPRRLLPNNTYFWRVRALDPDGNAGSWNVGPNFRKDFDAVTPTIPGLRVRDNLADSEPAVGGSGLPTTSVPVVAWDPVPGASSYEVRVVPWEGFCNWTPTGSSSAWTVTTAATAWTPLAPSWNGQRPLGNAFPTVAFDSFRGLHDNTSYCVRVRARSDRDAKLNEVVSDWTQLGDVGNAAFTYEAAPPSPCFAAATPGSAYDQPEPNHVSARMPLFTWESVPGACGYYVVVARDPEFTEIVDVALTNLPAYAPRLALSPTTYADETTSYYWAVMPTVGTNGDGLSTQPQEDAPRAFEKRSVPPFRLGPSDGGDVATQPSFRWTASEGAREYRIQVDADSTFGSPIADVLTNSTSYTPDQAFPADTVLYWRVRANDENKVGLTWSDTGTFRRRFPAPVASPDNPGGGETIPTLSWSPVEGAASYDMHVEQADGTKRDFTMRSTAFTPVTFYGTGIWRWQVRANFKAGISVVSGGYSGAQPFARRIATPTGIRTSRAGGGALLSWNPATMARQYKVQISPTDSFSKIIEQVVTSNTSFAPKMTAPGFASGGSLYWRVAVMDEGNNLGGFAATPLQNGRPMRVRLRGKLRRGHKGSVRITVTTSGRRRVAKALVGVSGPGLRARPRRTGRRGTVTFRVRPMARGTVRFKIEKRGYATAEAVLRVR
ncbi:MAG: isoprenylcysteine carboxylmethyltransferase family protein [Actinomycetota bacterium]|nr:isoprenylcysteine carboxylmethyltransferase family protein [Actinomycetota bacterium]